MFDLPVIYKDIPQSERRIIRERYRELQKDLCFYCKEKLSGKPSKDVLELPLNLNLFPENFLKHPIHLHHDHNTGLTIGAVHAYCNGILWQYEQS